MPAHDDTPLASAYPLYTWHHGKLLVLHGPEDDCWWHANEDEYLDWCIRQGFVMDDRGDGNTP